MAAPSIPRKGVSEPSYPVHRSSAAGPSSPDHHDEVASTPPPYSGPTSSSMSIPTLPEPQLNYPGLPRLNYALYSPQSFVLSSDKSTITSYEQRLSTNPAALLSLIQSLAAIPPKPIVRITGKGAGGETDFDLKINMMDLIVSDEDQARMNYMKVISNGELGFRGEGTLKTVPTRTGGLEEWARVFCEDESSIKHFALERTVTNWDTSYLEGRLLSLIVSKTSYHGHVTVTFPLTHSRVVVHSPDKVNRFFSNVTKVFTGTKKYEVVKSVWPYANVPRGEQGRTCAVQEEEVWFRNWSESIKRAVTNKRRGWVTAEDRLEFLMEPVMPDVLEPPEW